jgi:enamine deaminase RidA (YjgF/YER057c/UK114 family)
MSRKVFTSDTTPPPAGSYSVAMEAGGLVFLAGQTPRDRDNVRHGDKPFAFQARLAMDNLEAAANAAGLSLKDAVRVGVFLRNPADAKEFDAIYREYVREPFPVRTLVQSNFAGFDIEVDAVLVRST